MNKTKLTTINKIFGGLSLLFVASFIMVEWGSLNIKNEDEFAVYFLFASLTFIILYLTTLIRKIYLNGGRLTEKIVLAAAFLVLLIVIFILMIYFTFDISMI